MKTSRCRGYIDQSQLTARESDDNRAIRREEKEREREGEGKKWHSSTWAFIFGQLAAFRDTNIFLLRLVRGLHNSAGNEKSGKREKKKLEESRVRGETKCERRVKYRGSEREKVKAGYAELRHARRHATPFVAPERLLLGTSLLKRRRVAS